MTQTLLFPKPLGFIPVFVVTHQPEVEEREQTDRERGKEREMDQRTGQRAAAKDNQP